MLPDVGLVVVKVPRDVAGTFEPAIVKKRQWRLSGVDEMVLSLSAKVLRHGGISAHLAEVYGVSVPKATISTITESDGKDGRVVQLPARPRVSGAVRGRDQRENQGPVDDLVSRTV